MVRFNNLHNSIPYHLHKNLILLNLHILKILYKNKPVPLSYWIHFSSFINYLFPSLKHICPHPTSIESNGESIDVPELQHILKGEILGQSALDKTTIEFLWKKIILDQPRTIIEYGSGVSTFILAEYARLFHKTNLYYPIIISLEQNLDIKESIEKRLTNMDKESNVKIIYSPINEKGDYTADWDVLKKYLAGKKIDLILIDGPFGPPGCRINAIRNISEFCSETTEWFLDDAFRNGELWILQQWGNLAGIKIEGIYPFGKGFAKGKIIDSAKLF